MGNSCPFYHKQCNTFCTKCKKEVCCPRCHNTDMNDDEHFEATNNTNLRCNYCGETAELKDGMSIQCPGCDVLWGDYICTTCGIVCFPPKDVKYWHCKECGACMKGNKSQEFEHCSECKMCVEKNSQHSCFNSECPICFQHFAKSYGAVIIPACKHRIHRDCLVPELLTCPICRAPYPLKKEEKKAEYGNQNDALSRLYFGF